MNKEMKINIQNVSKFYKLFNTPTDRLKESLHPFGKKYSHDFYALNDITFSVKKGECVALLGKNGAGKSTLLKIITGIVTPSAGDVSVHGTVAALLELGSSFNPDMTGLENIYLNASLIGFTRKETQAKLQSIIAFADIGDFLYQPVKMYSSGMFARLAFAVSINLEPDILIVDEILAVGDLRFQIKCMDKMKSLMSGGATVLFVSHDLGAVRRLCSRAIWLEKGKLLADGEVNFVCDRYAEFINDNKEKALEKEKEKRNIQQSGIAEIVDVKVKDRNGRSKDIFQYNEMLEVEINYHVYDEKIAQAVLGVALYDCNDRYICGLNTLLDHKQIPWVKGKNQYSICYPAGVLALGGSYYFDVAIEDKTATIPIHYLKAAKEIRIESPYVSEGIYTIPHSWQEQEKG